MRQLVISHSLKLPLDAVTQKFAILGRTGSGKSYCATKLCEEMLEAEAQVVALDPVGVWYGLRSGSDFSIPIFGGLHGDVPLEAGAGEFIANLIVDRGISAVLDVSQFLSGDQARFAYDFATRFFFRKKSAPSAIHLFIEECQEFVPQNISGGNRSGFESRMLGAFERLIKLGRNFGIGASLISQRPQEVNKKALNQAECMLAFQMTGPQERKAVAAWVADKAGSQDVIDKLPKLAVGECQFWSPQWLQVDKTIHIAKKRTADVSSTPSAGAGKRVEPKPLSDSELAKLSDQMLETIQRSKSEDPKELRKQIAELHREKADLQRFAAKPPTAKVETKEILVLKDAQIVRLEGVSNRFSDACEKVQKAAMDVEELIGDLLIAVRDATATNANMQKSLHSRIAAPAPIRVPFPRNLPDRSPLLTGQSTPKADPRPKPAIVVDGELKISATQQRILDALAWFESIGNTAPSATQLGAIALIDTTGGHFSNVVGPLSSHGLVNRGNGVISLTNEGRKFARIPDNVSSLADYHEVLRQRVRRAKSAGGKTVEILDAVIRRGGAPITAEEIGSEVGIDHTGGHFSNTIGPLGSIGLIERNRGVIRPTEVLFPPGLS